MTVAFFMKNLKPGNEQEIPNGWLSTWTEFNYK